MAVFLFFTGYIASFFVVFRYLFTQEAKPSSADKAE